MKTRVQKRGNSLALRIPKSFAAEAVLCANAIVELSLVEGALVVQRVTRQPLTLDELFAASRTTTCPVSGIQGRRSARKSGESQRWLYPGSRRCGLDYPHPQAGHEQAGRRPALVLSPAGYNGRVGLTLFCPITSQVKGTRSR